MKKTVYHELHFAESRESSSKLIHDSIVVAHSVVDTAFIAKFAAMIPTKHERANDHVAVGHRAVSGNKR